MSEWTPFDSRPDPALGAELRAALDGSPAEGIAFVARMRAAVLAEAVETAWDILARWAPRGLAAAAAAAALAWVVIRAVDRGTQETAASAPMQMLVTPGQPEASVLTVSILEGR